MKKQFVIIFLLLLAVQASAEQRCPIANLRKVVNATSSGDNTVIASDPSFKIYVWQFFLVNSSATQDENVTLKEGSTATSGAYLLKANGGSHTGPCTGTPWAIVPAGSAFIVNLSAAGSLQGTAYYTLETP